MKIIDTILDFPREPNINNLQDYHNKYPEIFDYYLKYHLKNKDEKLRAAIEKYRTDINTIQSVHNKISYFIKKIADQYKIQYNIDFPINIYLIIGAYGSNAYTHRQIIPDITFALERLSKEDGPLQVIIAHEFGHAAQNILTDQLNTDWSKIQWTHPLNWLYREGVATYLSRKIIPRLEPSIYFSYNLEGQEWLAFAEENKGRIIERFYKDYKSSNDSSLLFKEWFSINGGTVFGHTRLAYFIGDKLFQDLVQDYGERKALLLWRNPDFIDLIENWFKLQAVSVK